MANWGISEQGWRKGPWTPDEDKLLIEYVGMNGEGRWSCVSKCAGLNRSGKSCRLRWVNYLRPGLKKGHMTPQEEGIIIELHAIWGNKWSTIARYLPGRTDNEIKNYWRTHFKKRKPANEIKQEKKKLFRQKLEQQAQVQDCNKNVIINTSPQEAAYDEHKSEEVEMDTASPIIENHQILPVLCQDNPSWTDFVQFDNLWGGLWNFEDQMNGCSKMAIQNQTSNAGGGYSCEGDGNNHMHNGGYIFG